MLNKLYSYQVGRFARYLKRRSSFLYPSTHHRLPQSSSGLTCHQRSDHQPHPSTLESSPTFPATARSGSIERRHAGPSSSPSAVVQ